MTPEALDVEFFKFHVKIVEDGSDPRNHLLEPPYFYRRGNSLAQLKYRYHNLTESL